MMISAVCGNRLYFMMSNWISKHMVTIHDETTSWINPNLMTENSTGHRSNEFIAVFVVKKVFCWVVKGVDAQKS